MRILLSIYLFTFIPLIFAEEKFDKYILDEDNITHEINILSTSSRLPQPTGSEPVPTTIIDSEAIERSGFNNIIDVFRLVPGMLPTYISGNTPILQRHGASSNINNSLLIMIDGRPIYTALFYNTDWQTVPINIHDIEKIEVVRSPNSSIYGSNAFKGSVNIITKKAHGETKTSIRTTQGSRNTKNYYIRKSGIYNDWNTGISLSLESDEGFHGPEEKDDDNDTQKLFVFAENNMPDQTLSIQTGFTKSRNQQGATKIHDYSGNTPIEHDIDSYFGYLNWKNKLSRNHDINFKLHHTNIDQSDDYKTSSLSTILGIDSSLVMGAIGKPDQQINYSYYDAKTRTTGVELFLTGKPDNKTTYSLGYILNHDEVNSFRWYGHNGWTNNNTHQITGHYNYKLGNNHIINSSILFEKNNFIDTTTSYRLSYLYHPTYNHSFRISLGRANQLPENVQSNGFNAAYYEDGDIIKLNYRGNNETVPAKNDIYEIGYQYKDSSTTNFDLNIFKYEISNVLDTKEDNTKVYPYDLFNRHYRYDNTGNFKVEGIEAQLEYKPFDNSYLRFFYTFLNAKGKTSVNVSDTKFIYAEVYTPKYIYGMLAGGSYIDNWLFNVGLYHTEGLKWFLGDAAAPRTRVDINLIKRFMIGTLKGDIQFTLHNIGGKHTDFFKSNIQETDYYIKLHLKF